MEFLEDIPYPEWSEFRVYSDDYDAYFCAACNKWLEPVCGASICQS
jgi:hypothetical protein